MYHLMSRIEEKIKEGKTTGEHAKSDDDDLEGETTEDADGGTVGDAGTSIAPIKGDKQEVGSVEKQEIKSKGKGEHCAMGPEDTKILVDLLTIFIHDKRGNTHHKLLAEYSHTYGRGIYTMIQLLGPIALSLTGAIPSPLHKYSSYFTNMLFSKDCEECEAYSGLIKQAMDAPPPPPLQYSKRRT